MKNIIFERYKIHESVGLTLLRSQDVTIATIRTLYEAFVSPRWSHFLGEEGEIIKGLERGRLASAIILPKYVLLQPYIDPQTHKIGFVNINGNPVKSFDIHGNVIDHTFNLIDMVEKYENNGDPSIIKLKKALLIHDLSEVYMRDETQLHGKTPEFKEQEYKAGKEVIHRLYKKMPHIEHEMLQLHDELEQKGDLYRHLKVYEEFSHLLGCLQTKKEFDHTGVESNYSDVCITFKVDVCKHLEKILDLRDTYPCVDKFIQEYGGEILAYFSDFPQDHIFYKVDVVEELKRIYSILPYNGK